MRSKEVKFDICIGNKRGSTMGSSISASAVKAKQCKIAFKLAGVKYNPKHCSFYGIMKPAVTFLHAA